MLVLKRATPTNAAHNAGPIFKQIVTLYHLSRGFASGEKGLVCLQECVVTSTRANAGLTCYLFCTETDSEKSATSHRTVRCCALTVRGRHSRCFCFPPIVEDQIDF
ncbi:unnamed protein product [Laminaria digitata]